jgi:NAD(P)-dependent dehydrogenase (short-subunit alcohol dehydrogenase family)
MRALKHNCAKQNVAISVVAPAVTKTPLVLEGFSGDGQTLESFVKRLAKNGVPINKPESVALAVCWLFNQGIKANGAGILIQADKFVDIERGLAKSRNVWMGREMLDLFRGGTSAPEFGMSKSKL